jgi:UPF0755 protein
MKKSCLSGIFGVLFLLAVLLGVLFVIFDKIIPGQITPYFGMPSPALATIQKMRYSFELFTHKNDLLNSSSISATDSVLFNVEQGESINSISVRLEDAGLIRDAKIFTHLLTYAGLDTVIQAGRFDFAHNMSPVEIAVTLADPAKRQIAFSILPGWRLEEIAASLPVSGLSISGEEFLKIATHPGESGIDLPFSNINTLEGLLFPGVYYFKRDTSTIDFIQTIFEQGMQSFRPEITNKLNKQGLNPYQGIILASIVQREAMRNEEMGTIASVFLNRLSDDMKLDSDPTVQYSLGFNSKEGTWWKNPLTLDDLKFDSPYNTYLYPGLPPSPISSPSQEAIKAVADPEKSGYLYFQARCDGSGYHNFARTFEEHLNNSCQ